MRANPDGAHAARVYGRVQKEDHLATDREPRVEPVSSRLLRAAKAGDPGARERIVEGHLRLVRAMAFRYRELGLPFEDLVQEGAIGLLEAIDRFEPSRGVEFRSFASWRIRRAILNALTEQSRLIRLPGQVVQRRRALARADARLMASNGHVTSTKELAADTGLSEEEVVQGLHVPGRPISLDEPICPEGEALANLLADGAAPDPGREAAAEERQHLLAEALSELPARERTIISRHFGVGRSPAPISQLAAELDLSAQRTRAIERDALYGLRSILESEGLG